MSGANPARDLAPWFAEGLTVLDSPIHGRGLFVTREIAAGELILRLGGNLLHLAGRRAPGVIPSTAVPLSEEIILAEPADGEKDFSDYLNHSCDPNIGFLDAISLVAIRNISAGEEIVIDYAFWEADGEWRLKQICNCGSSRCRKRVDGLDWKSVRPDEAKFRFFSPFLRRRIQAETECSLKRR